jgi:hypothetical protein
VYRRFDDRAEEEEEIDVDDLGLLGHNQDGETRVKPLKTLTRKTIKPTRLFQTDTQKRLREREREEEALTDVEDHPPVAESSTKPSANVSAKLEADDSIRKASPFDSWRRVKGSAPHRSTSKGQKRTSSEAFEDGTPVESVETTKTKKIRG